MAIGQTKREMVMGVCDAVSYKANTAEVFERFVTLQKDIGKSLGSKMRLERVDKYDQLVADLNSGKLDMAFVHPCHHAIRAIASGQYHLAALSKAHLNYRASFLVRSDSSLKSADQLAGKRVSLPDADSATAWLARAAIAEHIPDKSKRPTFSSERLQEVIHIAVDLKVVDAGATGSEAEVKAWVAAGNRVLFTSRSIPVKYFIVHDRNKGSLEQIRFLLLQQTNLSKIGITEGFVGFDETLLIKAGQWLSSGAV